jgi:hypothetical protein
VQFAFDQSEITKAAEFSVLSELASELKVDVFHWIFAGEKIMSCLQPAGICPEYALDQ